MPVQPPTGVVAFLFTDMEGSTKRWKQFPGSMPEVVARHDAILRSVIEAHNGYVFKTIGDAFCASFAFLPDALDAAIAAQLQLRGATWPEPGPIKVRMAIHAGTPEVIEQGDYHGPVVNRVARLLGLGHGGQVLLSEAAHGLLKDTTLPPGAEFRDRGESPLKDLGPEHVYEIVGAGLVHDPRPLRTGRANVPIWNVPGDQNLRFTGRETELTNLKQALDGGQRIARRQVLHGQGGVGKTQIAREFAFRQAADYDVVWWIPAAEPAALVAGYAALAARLHLPEAGEADQAVAIEAVKRWLEGAGRR
jgi:class 3 adenylate cyclase